MSEFKLKPSLLNSNNSRLVNGAKMVNNNAKSNLFKQATMPTASDIADARSSGKQTGIKPLAGTASTSSDRLGFVHTL